MQKYTNEFKKRTLMRIKEHNLKTKETARALNVPLKTLETWITLYNKNPKCFDDKKN